MGDLRAGRHLLTAAHADAAFTPAALAGSDAAVRVADHAVSALRARLAVYMRVAGGLPANDTLASMTAKPRQAPAHDGSAA